MAMKAGLLIAGYERAIRPLLFLREPEAVHEAVIAQLGRLAKTPAAGLARLVVGRPHDPVTIAGVTFPGRVGLAAGVDKDGLAARMWASLGFGFAELGTVTAGAQPGNPRPRLVRLPRSRALVNSMGFNNEGAGALAARLNAWGVRRGAATLGLPLGISIGKTKAVALEDAVGDYLDSLTAVHPYADYVAVNVSSPNTPGLRSLQSQTLVRDLVRALVARATELDGAGAVPIFVKVAPDLSPAELDDLVAAASGAGAAGLIATNTTIARGGVAVRERKRARVAGGLSGAPLTIRARQVVAQVVESGLPVIASGGIMTVADAAAMFDLGAQAVQVYTGFIYSGPGLVAAINARPRGGR